MMDYGQNEVETQGMDQLNLFGREGDRGVKDGLSYMGGGILSGL